MPQLTPSEVDEYLDGPHVAHFASIRRNGSPHVSPVWYRWDSGADASAGTVTVVSGDSAVKTRNVLQNPRVSLSIATDEWPYQYVILEGNAAVTYDNIEETVVNIFSRYEGEERGREDARELADGAEKLVVIVVSVDRVLSWKGDGE